MFDIAEHARSRCMFDRLYAADIIADVNSSIVPSYYLELPSEIHDSAALSRAEMFNDVCFTSFRWAQG